MINVPSPVRSRTFDRAGSGLSELFDEAQLACAGIMASEPWHEFLSSEEIKDVQKEKKVTRTNPLTAPPFFSPPCSEKTLARYLSEEVDGDLLGPALAFFTISAPIDQSGPLYEGIQPLRYVRPSFTPPLPHADSIPSGWLTR